MGKEWDHGVPGVPFWQAALRVLKPGGYMLAMGGSRTYHRLACAVEDAGFEIRDCLMWLYGTGFPKGAGCLKPAYEPILLARRPGPKVLPLGVDECRVPCEGGSPSVDRRKGTAPGRPGEYGHTIVNRITPERYAEDRPGEALGRWPANVLHDGSEDVLEAFAAFGEKSSHDTRDDGSEYVHEKAGNAYQFSTRGGMKQRKPIGRADSGSAARFFYCAKASRSERGEGNLHPTVKPLALMRWLVRLACPKGGRVLDPFGGSGTTGKACLAEGRRAVLIEREPAYAAIARKRIADEAGLFAAPAQHLQTKTEPEPCLPRCS
jgi:hypothetical protein